MAETAQNAQIGRVQIADEVISIIAGTAANEVEGVFAQTGFGPDFGKKNLAKGVKVVVDGQCVTVDITLSVKQGFKITTVSEEVQKRVKTAIETMTGLSCLEVNINVTSIAPTKQKPESKN